MSIKCLVLVELKWSNCDFSYSGKCNGPFGRGDFCSVGPLWAAGQQPLHHWINKLKLSFPQSGKMLILKIWSRHLLYLQSHRAEVSSSFITTTLQEESQVTPQGPFWTVRKLALRASSSLNILSNWFDLEGIISVNILK